MHGQDNVQSPSMTDATDIVVPAKALRKFSRRYLSLTAWAREPRVSKLIFEMHLHDWELVIRSSARAGLQTPTRITGLQSTKFKGETRS